MRISHSVSYQIVVDGSWASWIDKGDEIRGEACLAGGGIPGLNQWRDIKGTYLCRQEDWLTQKLKRRRRRERCLECPCAGFEGLEGPWKTAARLSRGGGSGALSWMREDLKLWANPSIYWYIWTTWFKVVLPSSQSSFPPLHLDLMTNNCTDLSLECYPIIMLPFLHRDENSWLGCLLGLSI